MKGRRPKIGSPPPRRSTSETTNATTEPVRLALLSNRAITSCGNSSTNTRSLVKNHRSFTFWPSRARTTAPMPSSTMHARSTNFIRPTEVSGASRRR